MNKYKSTKLLGIAIGNETKPEVLEKIKKYISSPDGFFHIVSLNPENVMSALKNEEFMNAVTTAQIRINDGVGVVLASRLLGVSHGKRITGVDLMNELVKTASLMRLRVLLIGGKANLAKDLAICYSNRYPEATFWGIKGIEDVQNPKREELESIFSIVASRKPHMIFVAFGSPAQEILLWRNREKFVGSVCMGVGGAFDYISGSIERPNSLIRNLGLEWLYRLFMQPWRWRRQLNLLRFVALVARQKVGLV